MTIPNYVHFRANVSHGIVSGGGVPYGCTCGVFVECIKCGRRDALQGGRTRDWLDQVTDDEAGEVFVSAGWTIRPTLCPDHVVD